MDKAYQEDIPKYRHALEALRVEFAATATETNWRKLRLEPLLRHVRSLERILESPKYARETARLRRGVSMFHADLVYLRANIQGLREILKNEREKAERVAARKRPSRSARSQVGQR